MDKRIYYLNLTNGLELYGKFQNSKFVRIQNSLLEAKCWNKVIYELDYNFLFDIAMGNEIVIIDCSQKKEKPRSIYQGIPWIEFVLNKRWLNKIITPIVKNINVKTYFEEMYETLNNDTKKKLDYVKKFLNPNLKEIQIKELSFSTKHDSDYEFYKNLLYQHQNILKKAS